ncbi:MAG: intermembrane transport protein PqiB [Pseudomonadota bacterium]
MSEAQADYEADIKAKKTHVAPIWIVPVVAVLIGIWLLVSDTLAQGPTIEIQFENADGLTAGQTRVKRLSVDLGLVTQVYLNEDFDSVTAVVELDRNTEELLRSDTLFWIVRPRIGSQGISGLGTLLSGAYIEISPGQQDDERFEFVGLEVPPLTPSDQPGVHLQLASAEAGSISVGSPILYNGYRVGRVESVELSVTTREARYGIFIDAPYNDLISTNTRFWNASGIRLDANSEGFAMQAQSLEAIVTGGIAFGLPPDAGPGDPVEPAALFRLFENERASTLQPYAFGAVYLLLFDSSIRGLVEGAPVDYRGQRMGTVIDTSPDLLADQAVWTSNGHALMPVLIRLEPGRYSEDSLDGIQASQVMLEQAVLNGLRATLASGNLLTGSLYIDLDFYDNVAAATITETEAWLAIPTTTAGIAQIERQVSTLLDQLGTMPVDDALVAATSALQNVGTAMKSADSTLQGLNRMLDDPSTADIPTRLNEAVTRLDEVLEGLTPGSSIYQDLDQTINELRQTTVKAGALVDTLQAQPNLLILPKDNAPDPMPGDDR